jgi:hypothetical protein
MPTAPKAITELITKFCEQIAPGSRPVYLPITPAEGAKEANCFPTVAQQVIQHGGEAVIGWQIWEIENVLVEAEFHAVWRDPQGTLQDITPKPGGTDQILFLPDPARRYQGRQVDNMRQPISGSPAVTELIAASEAEFEFFNRNDRADRHEVKLTPTELEELEGIRHRKRLAQAGTTALYYAAQRATSLPKPCPCASGLTFEECHGAL